MAEDRSTVDELYAAAVAEAQAAEERVQGMTVHSMVLPRWLADAIVLHSRVEGVKADGGHVCEHLRAAPGVALAFVAKPGVRVCRGCVAAGAVDDVVHATDAGCDRCGAPGARHGMVVRFGADLLWARLCAACSDPATWPAYE